MKFQLERALARSASTFTFRRWQRAVKYKYSLHPLSTAGSITSIGGRFNVGDIAALEFPPFSALYLAEDKDTALQEALGQEPIKGSQLTPREVALTNPQSETIVSVSGRLESALDLRVPRTLDRFVSLTRRFTLTPGLSNEARRLRQVAPGIVQTSKDLLKTIMKEDWRISPQFYEIPANGQILGQLALAAGIEGIVYRSRFTHKDCMAIFPHNLEQSTGYVELDDESPESADVPDE